MIFADQTFWEESAWSNPEGIAGLYPGCEVTLFDSEGVEHLLVTGAVINL